MIESSHRDTTAQIRRREFVVDMARKAVYVAPAVLVLMAPRHAGADFTGCVGPGSPCNVDGDCCTGFSCLKPTMTACAGAEDCTCQ